MEDFNTRKLKRELLIDAKALGIPVGSAEIFIDRAITAATKKLSLRSVITPVDIKSAVAKELKKYNKDFAYVYQNRDKII
jgi:hypothetical protein